MTFRVGVARLAWAFPVMGTLAILLAAKRAGRLDTIREIVHELVERGMYLSERIIREVLAAAGE